jgi:hypothetical protein
LAAGHNPCRVKNRLEPAINRKWIDGGEKSKYSSVILSYILPSSYIFGKGYALERWRGLIQFVCFLIKNNSKNADKLKGTDSATRKMHLKFLKSH